MSKYIIIFSILIYFSNCFNHANDNIHFENKYIKGHLDYDTSKYNLIDNFNAITDGWESSTLIRLEDTINGVDLKVFYELPELNNKDDLIAHSIEVDKMFKKAEYHIIEKMLDTNFNADKKIYFHSAKHDFIYTFGVSSSYYKPEGYFQLEFTKKIVRPKEIKYADIVNELRKVSEIEFKVDEVKESLQKIQKTRGILEE